MSSSLLPTDRAPSPSTPLTAHSPPPTPAPAPAPSPTTARPPAAPFTPFFTLVSTPDSPTTHHPSVHYLFSDDADSDLITAAALQTLSPPSSASVGGARPRPLPAAPKTRFIVVDLDDAGRRVLAARSMAPDWQVVGAHVEPAPTWEGEGDGKGLLLRVEGVGVGGLGGKEEGEGLEALVEGYMKRLGELRGVVEGGGGGGVRGRHCLGGT